MLDTLAIAAGVIALALAALLLIASRRPDTFAYARSIAIAAPPERIYPLINDLKAMNRWNPFATDPSLTFSYSGPAAGPGASYAFASKRAGTGHFDITDTVEPRLVGARLVMTKPMACDNRVEFRLEPGRDGTTVTWAMSGRQNLMSKVMCTFMDGEKMCGGMFDKGLADLKALAEGERKAA